MRTKTIMLNIWALLGRIDAGLITREPNDARSAEAYDGLRKQINQSSKNRRIHVSHLLSLSDSIEREADYQLIKDRVADFLLELGVSRTYDLSRMNFFEVSDGAGESLVCTAPAVIETLDDGSVSLVRMGRAEWILEAVSSVSEAVLEEADAVSDSVQEEADDVDDILKEKIFGVLRILIFIATIVDVVLLVH